MEKNKWIWMPHPGHFICSANCQFILNTYVGGFIVSTVGEYVPDAPVREIIAESRKITLKGKGDCRLADYMKKIGYEKIGYDRKYETMVFPSKKSSDNCCPYVAKDWIEVDIAGYNDSGKARNGHYKMCDKWTK